MIDVKIRDGGCESGGSCEQRLLSVLARVATFLSALSFWTSVLAPLLYLPLFVGGFGGARVSVAAALVFVHGLAVVGGRNHRRGSPGRCFSAPSSCWWSD